MVGLVINSMDRALKDVNFAFNHLSFKLLRSTWSYSLLGQHGYIATH